ncbi:MAG: cysteine desulfurase family protein [Pirellulales bacterium]
MKSIYFDYNATTPIAPSVIEAMRPYLAERSGSPGAAYTDGLIAMEAVEQARERVAQALGADCEEIVFTSGGTEANNLALKGTLLDPARYHSGGNSRGHLVISAVEHDAVAEPARFLAQFDVDVTVVPTRSHGIVDPVEIEAALRSDTRLVSIVHANHEIGAIQPVAAIARLCREREILVHTDATQSLGKIRTQVDELHVDLLSISGHKIYGPKGIGALFVRRGTQLAPLLHGEGQEHGLRAGMENVPAVVGFAQAAHLAEKSVDEFDGRIRGLRDLLWDGLKRGIPELHLHGDPRRTLPNTLSVAFPGASGADLLASVPELSACAAELGPGRPTVASPTLRALHATPELAAGTVRFSLGWHTSSEEIERATELLCDAWERVR